MTISDGNVATTASLQNNPAIPSAAGYGVDQARRGKGYPQPNARRGPRRPPRGQRENSAGQGAARHGKAHSAASQRRRQGKETGAAPKAPIRSAADGSAAGSKGPARATGPRPKPEPAHRIIRQHRQENRPGRSAARTEPGRSDRKPAEGQQDSDTRQNPDRPRGAGSAIFRSSNGHRMNHRPEGQPVRLKRGKDAALEREARPWRPRQERGGTDHSKPIRPHWQSQKDRQTPEEGRNRPGQSCQPGKTGRTAPKARQRGNEGYSRNRSECVPVRAS